MVAYSFVFFLVALVAGLLGSGGLAGASAIAARFCFVVFSILVAASVLVGLAQRGDSSSTAR